MAITVNSQQKFGENLFKYILSRTVGDHSKDEETFVKPSRRFIVGNLAAKKHEKVEREDEGSASIRATRLKVSFLIDNNVSEGHSMEIESSGYVFYPVSTKSEKNGIGKGQQDDIEDDSDDTPHMSRSWRRVKFVSINNVEIPNRNGQITTPIDFSLSIINTDQSRNDTLDSTVWQASLLIERNYYDDHHDLLSISLTNEATEPLKEKNSPKKKFRDRQDRTLFDCKLRCSLYGVTVRPFIDEYKYNTYLQRYFYYFRTTNCQAYWVDNTLTKFGTRHYAKYDQDNILPRQSIANLDLSFYNLANEETMLNTISKLIEILDQYSAIYKGNLLNRSNSTNQFQPQIGASQKTWKEREDLIDDYGSLLLRLKKGVDEITNDDVTRRSFIYMNQTFHEYYKNRGISNGKWRLFQLIFILGTISSVTKNVDLDTVDILHVNTGGGKSEAYFGLVVFAIFYERAKGKSEGVTAIVKFPLRMLSIQQLERISSIIIYSEQIRLKNSRLFPGTEFSLGYFIGESEDFPKNYKDLRERLYNLDGLRVPAPPSIIISSCPLCDKSNRGVVRLTDDTNSYRIVHQCDRCKNRFFIYMTSKEIYRWRPTVLVSTVDKWVGIDQQLRTRNLLGGKGSMCESKHGFITSGAECEKNNREEFYLCNNIGKNGDSSTGPLLSIQDEMHLLSQGFGTIASHFEGLVEALVEETSSRKLKHIAMSATLNGADNQSRELYNKNCFIFPGRCPEEIGGDTDPFFEKKEGPKRIIFGLKPNLRDNHYASLRTLLHYCEFILEAQKELHINPSAFCESYKIDQIDEGQSLINQFLIPLTYHIKKQDAYDMQRLETSVITEELNRGLDDEKKRRVNGVTLTGDSSLEDLKESINSIRKIVKNYDSHSDDKGDAEFKPVYATSVVSHGVDLDELNFMVFQGLPYSTSEYIQALSRVGRKNLGIVILWFYPNRIRDDSFYRNFQRYHETLDHQVKPIPISRNSKLGLYQTLNSIFCASIINYLSNKTGYPIINKKAIKDLTKEQKRDLENFITKCYTGSYSKKLLNIENIGDEIDARFQQIIESSEKDYKFFPDILSNSGNYYYRNQRGMRGIQKELRLRLDQQDESIALSRRGSK